MVQAMLVCEQTKGQTIYQHGLSVEQYFNFILDHLKGTYPLPNGWRIPTWLDQYKEEILSNYDKNHASTYLLFHDCGKPWCRENVNGTVHFPNHAEVSRNIFLSVNGNQKVAQLISWDMVIHTESAEEIDRYCREKWETSDAVTLLIAALAEIHSNSRLFGGIDSVSFKAKWKTIDRRGRQILKFYFGEKQ